MPDEQPNLRSQNWDDLYPRVLADARRIAKGRPNAGLLAQDLAQQAVVKTFSGERRWNFKEFTLFQHLHGVMESELSHRDTSYQNRNGEQLEQNGIINLADYRPSPEEEEMNKSQERNLLAFLEARNAKAKTLAELIMRHDITSCKELSAVMDITETRAEYLKKRLRVLLVDYIKWYISGQIDPVAQTVLQKIEGGVSNNER